MTKLYLVTGGAGFIGCHLVDELLAAGHRVRVLDPLIEQVHGQVQRPAMLADAAELVTGDITDAKAVSQAVRGVDGVFHLAAMVGVGQSMYEIDRYTRVNDLGTAVLLQALIDDPVPRIVVASSMSVYGEGLYRDAGGRPVVAGLRDPKQLKSGRWDPVDAAGRPLAPVATPESKPVDLASVYALNKYVQERMTLIAAGAYGMEAAALRLFNVFGPGQALSNPYTGVLAIFASRLFNGRPPLVFEDGSQRRDFVHVKDVARAFRLAMDRREAAGEVINVGSGRSYTITEVAERLAAAMGRPEIAPEITGEYRSGDIRHCFADMAKAATLLDFAPQRFLEDNLAELADWVATQVAEDKVADATAELKSRGLVA